MKNIKITTPENIEVEYTLADLGSRASAAAIDTLLQFLIYIVIAVPLIFAYSFAFELVDIYYGWIIGIAILLYGFIVYGYFIVMEMTMNGMTPGKKLLKLRTIRSNGQPITFKHSAIRNILRIFIDAYGVGLAMIFFTKHCKRIGDYAASTIVIVEQKKARPVLLDGLKEVYSHLGYYLCQEEYELLLEYFERRKEFTNSEALRKELQMYFTKKFDDLGMTDEAKALLESL